MIYEYIYIYIYVYRPKLWVHSASGRSLCHQEVVIIHHNVLCSIWADVFSSIFQARTVYPNWQTIRLWV